MCFVEILSAVVAPRGGGGGGGGAGGGYSPPVGEPQPLCRGILLNLSGKSDIKMKN